MTHIHQDNPVTDAQLQELLSPLGIDKEQFTRLPEEVKDALRNGGLTPLIAIGHKLPNGRTLMIPVKLQICQTSEGNKLMLYPISSKVINNLDLTKTQLNTLGRGKALFLPIEVNGTKQNHLLQLDPQTKHIMRAPLKKMQEKLALLESIHNIQLGMEQKQAMLEGKPVRLDVGGESVIVGVDLREPQGFKIMRGNMDDWKRQQAIAYDEAHPEYVGLVKTDKNRWEYHQFQVGNFARKAESVQKHKSTFTQSIN